MTMFKLGGKYKTRNGEDEWLVLYERDDKTLAVLVGSQGSQEAHWFWKATGWYYEHGASGHDLMPRAKEVTRYVPASTQWGFATEDSCREVYPDCAVASITFTIPDDGGSDTQ